MAMLAMRMAMAQETFVSVTTTPFMQSQTFATKRNGTTALKFWNASIVIADICLRDLSIPTSMLAVRTAMTQETFVSMTTMPALIVHRGVLPAAMPAMHTAMTQKCCFCDDDAGSDFGVLPAAMPTIRTAITQETLFL